MIKHEQSGIKVAIIDEGTLEDENFCLKLFPDSTAHFMTVEKAITLSNLIQKAVDQYYNEHPEKIMEQYIEP